MKNDCVDEIQLVKMAVGNRNKYEVNFLFFSHTRI